MTQAEVHVTADVGGLSFLQLNPKKVKMRFMLMANDFMKGIPKRSFRVVVSNFGNQMINLAKNIIMELAIPAPVALISPPSFVGDDQSNEGTFKPQNNDPSEQEQETEVAHPAGWKQKVRIGVEHESEPERITDFLELSSDMLNGDLGVLSIAKQRLCLEEGSKPLFQMPYRAGQKPSDLETEKVTKQRRSGVIEPSFGEWASPVVFSLKKYGTLRFCVDYHHFNAMTVRDTYPIPMMNQYIDSLSDAVVFTTLDANSG